MGRRRELIIAGDVPTDHEMEEEDLAMQASSHSTAEITTRKIRGTPKDPASLTRKKIRGNLDLSPYVNSRLNTFTEKLGMTKQSLVMRYILEGLQRDENYFRNK